MKKSLNLLLIISLVAILFVSLVACDGLNVNNPSFSATPYTAYEITKVDITQLAASTYDFVVTSDIVPSNNTKVYVTRYDKIGEDDTPVSYTVEDGKVHFTAGVKYASYYIFVVDGDKTAYIPMTRPQMAPSLTATDVNVILTYNFVNGTSWSSFCDPTGKSVYKSSKSTFDESASLVAKNVKIWQADSTTDVSPDKDMPYYYVVLSAKNGIVNYVSAPLTTVENAYSDIKVSLVSDNDVPTLKVSGKFASDGDVAVELYSADTKLGKVLEIVGENVTGNKGDSFETTLDVSQVVSGETGAGIWYDIKLASRSGSLFEVSESTADMSQTVKDKNTTFEFKSWNKILKLNYQYYDFDVEEVKVIVEGGKAPYLSVKGTVTEEIKDVKLHCDYTESDGEKKSKLWDNLSQEEGRFEFKVELTDLSYDRTPWSWFHIYTYKGNATVGTSNDLPRGEFLSIGQEFTYNGVLYTIRAYEGTGAQLAIQAEKK